jgi:hypothetical protein
MFAFLNNPFFVGNLKLVWSDPSVVWDAFVVPRILHQWLPRHRSFVLRRAAGWLGLRPEEILWMGAGSNVLNVLTKSSFYKIGLSSKMVSRERARRQQALADVPHLSRWMLPSDFLKTSFFGVLVSPRAVPLEPAEQIPAAEHILRALRDGASDHVSCAWSDSLEIQTGLRIVRIVCGENMVRGFRGRLDAIFARALHWGPAHGDFHPDNLLKDHSGAPVAIDWDCYRSRGVQSLDAVYFIVESEARALQMTWGGAVANLLEHAAVPERFGALRPFLDGPFDDLLFVYFLDRLGQDAQYGKVIRRTMIDEMNKVVALLRHSEAIHA